MSRGAAPEPGLRPVGRLADGTPYFAPPGELIYDPDEDRVQCHLCGAWLRSLPGRHLMGAHGWTANRYRAAFGLAPRNGLSRPATRRRRAELMRERIATDPELRASMAAQQDRARSGELAELSAQRRRGAPRPLESVRVSARNRPPLDYEQVAASRRANRDARDAARFGFDSFDDYVRDRRRRGWSPAQIAAECGRHSQTLRNRVARLEGEPRNLHVRSRARLDRAVRAAGFPDLRSYLQRRHLEDGLSAPAMVAELGIGTAPETLRNELARHGIPYDPGRARRRRAAHAADEAARRRGFDTFAAYLDARLAEGGTVTRLARELDLTVTAIDARATALGRTVPRIRRLPTRA
ncbi:MAG: MucR family transcriptional regulator [Solirubrobacteraceae bacterium]